MVPFLLGHDQVHKISVVSECPKKSFPCLGLLIRRLYFGCTTLFPLFFITKNKRTLTPLLAVTESEKPCILDSVDWKKEKKVPLNFFDEHYGFLHQSAHPSLTVDNFNLQVLGFLHFLLHQNAHLCLDLRQFQPSKYWVSFPCS